MGADKCLFIEQAIGSHPFCFVLSPGKEIDLHCSAPARRLWRIFRKISAARILRK